MSNTINLVENFAKDLEKEQYDTNWIQCVAKPSMIAICHSYETPLLNWTTDDEGIISAVDNSGNIASIRREKTETEYYRLTIRDCKGQYLSGYSGPFIEGAKAAAENTMDCESSSNSILEYYRLLAKYQWLYMTHTYEVDL